MDHCPSLSDEGAMVMALVLGKSLKELDWSYCVPGLGASAGGDGRGRGRRRPKIPTSSHSATVAMRGGSGMAMSTAMDSDYSDDDDHDHDGGYYYPRSMILYSRNGCARVAPSLPPTTPPPPAAMLPLSFIAFFMQQQQQQHGGGGGGGGIKSLYLIGHKYITDDAMLGVREVVGERGTEVLPPKRCGGFGPIYMAHSSLPHSSLADTSANVDESVSLSAAALLPSLSYRSLRDVDVSGTGLTREGVAALRVALSTDQTPSMPLAMTSAPPAADGGYRARVVYADEEEY